MIAFFLNYLPVKYGSYYAQGYKIRRRFSNGFSYVASTCKSPQEASRIAQQLNSIKNS